MAAQLGVAVYVDFHKLQGENFKNQILEITTNVKYAEKAKTVSKLFRDKPQKAIERAVWWAEFVIRNPSLDHLKSPTLKMSPFAAQSYDVILVFVLFMHVLIFVFVKIFKVLLCKSKSLSKPKRE